MGTPRRGPDPYLRFSTREELWRYVEQLADKQKPRIAYDEEDVRIVVSETKFSRSRACAVAEIGERTANAWERVGLALTRGPQHLPRSTAVAELCVIRDLLAIDVPLGPAVELGRAVAKTVMSYALKSSPDLTVVRKSDGVMFRKVKSTPETNEAYLVKFLGKPLGRFAAITGSTPVVFSDHIDVRDHVSHAVLDLENIGARMASRSGPLVNITILPDRRHVDE